MQNRHGVAAELGGELGAEASVNVDLAGAPPQGPQATVVLVQWPRTGDVTARHCPRVPVSAAQELHLEIHSCVGERVGVDDRVIVVVEHDRSRLRVRIGDLEHDDPLVWLRDRARGEGGQRLEPFAKRPAPALRQAATRTGPATGFPAGDSVAPRSGARARRAPPTSKRPRRRRPAKLLARRDVGLSQRPRPSVPGPPRACCQASEATSCATPVRGCSRLARRSARSSAARRPTARP